MKPYLGKKLSAPAAGVEKLSELETREEIEKCFRGLTQEHKENTNQLFQRTSLGPASPTQAYKRNPKHWLTTSSSNFSAQNNQLEPSVFVPAAAARRSFRVNTLPTPAQIAGMFDLHLPADAPASQQMELVLEQLVRKLKSDLAEFSARDWASCGPGEEQPEAGDVCGWLRVHSKYKMLRKRAQERLVEYISDETAFKNYEMKLSYDHMEQMDEEYDRILQAIEQDLERGRPGAREASQEKIQVPINYLMRKRIQEDRNKKLESQARAEEEEAQAKRMRVLGLERAEEGGPQRAGKEAKLSAEAAASNLEWTREEEARFRENVKAAKKNFSKMVSSANFKDAGFKDIYLALRKKSNLHNLRNFLLEKLQDSQWLSEAELRYLTYSSKLTYKVLPKDYFKEAVRTISPEVKDDLIASIADDILTEYLKIRAMISNSRNQFLKEKTDNDLTKVTGYMKKLALENESLINIVGLKKWKQTNSRYCLKRVAYWEEKQEAKDAADPDRRKDADGRQQSKSKSKLPAGVEQRNKNELQRMIKERRMQSRNEFLRRNLVKLVNSNELGLMHIKNLRHLPNPASKVLKMPTNLTTPNQQERDLQAAHVLQTMYDYKNLGMKESSKDEIARYQRLYSGGPFSRRHEPKNLDRDKAARLIQKVWRGYFERKMLDYLKSLPNRKALSMFTDKKSLKNAKVSKYFASMILQKSTLINPQNQQRLVLKQAEENRTKNQRDFNKRIDREIREKIMKKNLKHFSKPIGSLMNSGVFKQAQEAPPLTEEEEEKQQKIRSIYSKNNLHIKQTALLNACRENKSNFLKKSTYNYSKPDVNILDKEGNSSLFYACKHHNFYMVHFLLKKGANVNKRCSNGNTALHAVFTSKRPNPTDQELYKQADIIKLLVTAGGDLDALNDNFQTPICFGFSRLLRQLHLYEGKSSFNSREEQVNLGLRHHNLALFNQSCDVPEPPVKAIYEFKRCSSASTMTSVPVVEHFRADHNESIYDRRAKYVKTDEYHKLISERGDLFFAK